MSEDLGMERTQTGQWRKTAELTRLKSKVGVMLSSNRKRAQMNELLDSKERYGFPLQPNSVKEPTSKRETHSTEIKTFEELKSLNRDFWKQQKKILGVISAELSSSKEDTLNKITRH